MLSPARIAGIRI